jgi:hypothetical protein
MDEAAALGIDRGTYIFLLRSQIQRLEETVKQKDKVLRESNKQFEDKENAYRSTISKLKQSNIILNEKLKAALYRQFCLMKEQLRKGRLINMDETVMRVMDEPGRENRRQSRMWVARGGPPWAKVVWYEYKETREAKHAWLLNQGGVLPSSLLGKAVSYTLGQWPMLLHYLDYWELTPDNNAAERAVKPFVMGRKNWVMSGSPAGAKSSCRLYSLIETAKENGLNPYWYLVELYNRVPLMTASDDWSRLLPWNIQLTMPMPPKGKPQKK